jgi:hypothetical protein
MAEAMKAKVDTSMAIHGLMRKETPHRTVAPVWFDSDGEDLLVQHKVVHSASHKCEVEAFLQFLRQSWANWRRIHGGTR